MVLKVNQLKHLYLRFWEDGIDAGEAFVTDNVVSIYLKRLLPHAGKLWMEWETEHGPDMWIRMSYQDAVVYLSNRDNA